MAVRAGETDAEFSNMDSWRRKIWFKYMYTELKNHCIRRLKECQAVKDYMERSGSVEPPICLEAWVDARCCLGMN